MNAINPSTAAPNAQKSSWGVKVRENQMRSHLSDMERVQSIVWGLAAHMRHLVEESYKETKNTAKVDAAEAEAFADNVEWLINAAFEDTFDLRKSLRETEAAS